MFIKSMLINKSSVLSAAMASIVLVGCDNNDNHSKKDKEGKNNSETPTVKMQTYEVTLTNLTTNQPLSPPLVVLHDNGYAAFTEGERASIGLERLAEGGVTSGLISEVQAYSGSIDYAQGAVIQPGKTTTLTINTNIEVPKLTVLSMLENTNDAFTGIGAYDLGSMVSTQSIVVNGPVWDSGTEVNDELASTIPGPVSGGQGFNSERLETPDKVTFHQGVLTKAQGLTDSVLDESYRFDQPAIKISISKN